MEIYFDTEFLDDGRTIRPISIGMVKETGEEYYAIFNNALTIADATNHPWLKANVLPYLPLVQPIDPGHPYWDESHPDYVNIKRPARIAKEVHDFITSVPSPSLWAYFSAYDHVVLAQLYGRPMVKMPLGIPQRTNDIAQEMERLNYNPGRKNDNKHNSLSDAREVKWMRGKLKEYEYGKKTV
jgi:hypothetical protein